MQKHLADGRMVEDKSGDFATFVKCFINCVTMIGRGWKSSRDMGSVDNGECTQMGKDRRKIRTTRTS
jgi:hypothetical protein